MTRCETTIFAPRTTAEHRQCLSVLLDQPGMSRAQLDSRVDTLVGYAQRKGLSLERCLFIRRGGEIWTACLAVDAPGRMTSVFIPSSVERLDADELIMALLARAVEDARERGTRIVQACLPPEALREADLYRQAGFTELAQLIYMDRDVTVPTAPERRGPELHFEGYTPAEHARFAEVVQGTYEDSLDCAPLNAVRDIEDILASHLGGGPFRPELWRLASAGGEPIGAVLLSSAQDRWAWEVVYLGLLPAWRGRGYGRSLLTHAIALCRAEAVPTLTLSVDATNHPALALYQGLDFLETMRRDVWITVL